MEGRKKAGKREGGREQRRKRKKRKRQPTNKKRRERTKQKREETEADGKKRENAKKKPKNSTNMHAAIRADGATARTPKRDKWMMKRASTYSKWDSSRT